MSRADPHACEPRTHGATIALPPSDRLPGRIGQRFRQGLDRDRMSTLTASDQSWRSPPATIRWWPRRLRARPPGRRLTGDPHHVGDAPFREGITKRRHHTESGIRNHRGRRQSFLAQRGDLVECYLPLRLERHLLRNRRLSPTPTIAGPHLRKVQTIGRRNAHRLVRHGDRNCNLAVVLLAEHTTVLARHPDRVTSLLRDPRIVRDPGGHRAVTLHLLQHVLPCHLQDRFLVPRSVGNKVMQGLMTRPHVPRVDSGGHRLNALPLSGQTQADQIPAQRPSPILVPEHGGNPLQVILEPRLRTADSLHHEQYRRPRNGLLRSFYDTVVLADCREDEVAYPLTGPRDRLTLRSVEIVEGVVADGLA